MITGATAGIGAEFARQLGARGFDLVLVARDSTRLAATATAITAASAVTVETITADLQTLEGLDAVETRVGAATRPIDYLVNNAGFGLRTPFDENDVDIEQGLLDLLVTVPMRLSHAALQQMLPRRTGTIVNISSVAAFTPRGTYGAAKAWLLSFSRWANAHYAQKGITVTAVAPGFVRTEFHERMAVRTDTVPGFLWLEVSHLVRIALRDIDRGKALSVPTVRYKLLVALARITPARIAGAGTLRGR